MDILMWFLRQTVLKDPEDMHIFGKCIICGKTTRRLYFNEIFNSLQNPIASAIAGPKGSINVSIPVPKETIFNGVVPFWNIAMEGESGVIVKAVCDSCTDKHEEFIYSGEAEEIEGSYRKFKEDFKQKMLSYVDDEEAREVISNIINYGDYPREFRWLFRKLAKEKSHKACYEAIKKELTDRLPEIKSQEDKKRFFRKFDLESVFYPDYFAGSKVNEVKRNLDKLCKLYRDDMKITDVCKCLIDSIASSASDIANEAGLWSEEAKQDLEEQDELILEHELDEDNLYRHVTIPVLSPNLVITQSGIPFTDFYKLRVLDLWVPSDSEILVKREALVKKFPELDLEPNENRQCW